MKLPEAIEQQWLAARARFAGLAAREQKVLAAGAAIVALALLYFALWLPAESARQRQAQSLADARALSMQLAALAPAAERARGSGLGTASNGVSLLAAVDQATRDGSLPKPPTRLQPDGDTRVRLWFEDVPFDALLQWLQRLQQRQGIRVDSAEFDRKPTSGLADARLSLVRGR
ncbi:MAG: type II secretion system protein M [Gammaproteobacteria bacterium]|nr:type II secretion system protein M [Gammaproteobacteria bacterium]